MNIDRRPICSFIITNGNWASSYRPELNPWGYTNAFRKTGVQGVLDNMDQAIAMGYRRLCIAKPIGTAPGADVVAACNAMYSGYKTEWPAKLLPWLSARKAQYPDLLVGFYTGSQFEKLDSLACNPDSPNIKSAVDTSSPEATANFHACHDFLIINLKADFLIFDKGSTVDHGTQLVSIPPGFSTCKFISEAVRRQFEFQLPMFARTTFWFQSNSPGIDPNAVFDPSLTEIHWWLQQDFDVPNEGPALLEYVKKLWNQGIIACCQWPFGAQEVIDGAKSHGWWFNNMIVDKD